MLTPLWWVLGAGFFIFHALAILLAFRYPARLRPNNFFQYGIVGLIFVLTVSLFYNSAAHQVDLVRIVAAANNVSILCVGYILFSYFQHEFTLQSGSEINVAKSVGAVSALSILVGSSVLYLVLVGRIETITFPTAFGLLTPRLDNLLGLYQIASVISIDWFAETSTPRLTIFSTNATSSAALIAISGFICLSLIAARFRLLAALFIAALLLTIAATLTRGALVGALAGTAMFAVLTMSSRMKIALSVFTPLAVAAFFYFAPAAFEKMNSAREASSNTRMTTYRASVEITLSNNPVIGIGVKPKDESLIIPIGSHSTVISTLVRGGLVGASLAIACFILYPATCCIRIIWRYVKEQVLDGSSKRQLAIACGTPSFLAYCLLQDIDAYAPLASFMFLYLALLSHYSRNSSTS